MSITFPTRALLLTSRASTRSTISACGWERLSLIGILLLSALLELWHLNQLGTSNAFYAAAVFSMLQNWHAFFFNSLDATGFVTIDKPPLGFWIQAAGAKLLGFSGVSILLPEALATVGSVALLYALVKRAFGSVAGLLAALMLALVPISVTVGRNNTIDSLLVLTLLVSVWTGLKATERGSLRWLLATGAIVGLGFEIKMLEAYLVVPAPRTGVPARRADLATTPHPPPGARLAGHARHLTRLATRRRSDASQPSTLRRLHAEQFRD